jgi:SAM-dependent methyltransferase
VTIANTAAVHAESGWEIWHDWNVEVMKPVTAWFCDAIHAADGQVVLDIACGTGIPSLGVAARVAPSGRVVATDVSPVMLRGAARKAKAAGIANIEHREMSAEAFDFPDASFDAVTLKDGLMFCPDPVKALAEIRRVLRPGGRFALTVWDEFSKCHFFNTMFGPVSKALNRPPPDPAKPGPFRFSAPGELERTLHAAGFSDFTIERRDVYFEFASLDEHWSSSVAMAAPVEAANSTLPPAELAALRRAIASNLAPFMVGERVRVPNLAQFASGARS